MFSTEEMKFSCNEKFFHINFVFVYNSQGWNFPDLSRNLDFLVAEKFYGFLSILSAGGELQHHLPQP